MRNGKNIIISKKKKTRIAYRESLVTCSSKNRLLNFWKRLLSSLAKGINLGITKGILVKIPSKQINLLMIKRIIIYKYIHTEQLIISLSYNKMERTTDLSSVRLINFKEQNHPKTTINIHNYHWITKMQYSIGQNLILIFL